MFFANLSQTLSDFEKMKIAILTFTFQTNYGCILQAYALQTVLERLGYEVEHLQEKDTNSPLHPMWKMP